MNLFITAFSFSLLRYFNPVETHESGEVGDVATCFSGSTKSEQELGWKAELGLKRMCQDTWRWQSKNPNGYNIELVENNE